MARFGLLDTETEADTDIDKLTHILSVSIGLGVTQCEHTIRRNEMVDLKQWL